MTGTMLTDTAIFFNEGLALNISSLWTGVLALSFAFSGPVAELVNSCVWVFAKHSYDVGDTVEVMSRTLEVRQIFLTHTNFEEAADSKIERTEAKIVQISHTSLSGEVLVNWTLSHDAGTDVVVAGINGGV